MVRQAGVRDQVVEEDERAELDRALHGIAALRVERRRRLGGQGEEAGAVLGRLVRQAAA